MRMTAVAAVCWLCGLVIAMEWGNAAAVLCAAAIASGLALCLALRSTVLRLASVALIFMIAILYGIVTERGNRSQLPESGTISVEGTIASPVVVDGDRVRFRMRLSEPGGERLAVTVKLSEQAQQQEADAWRQGDRIALTGELSLPPHGRNFGQFDYARYLERKKVHRLLRSDNFPEVRVMQPAKRSAGRLLAIVDDYRGRLADRISLMFPEQQSGFMSGMLIGVRTQIDEALYDRFSRLGLTHIIAISGLHVAVVVGGWLLVLRLVRVTRETATLSALFLIPPYMLLSGAAPSVLRAGMMAMIALIAHRFGWMKDALQIMAFTAVILTAVNPYMLYDVGFQLSYLVTAGLIVFVPLLRKLLPARPAVMYDGLAVTLVAQLVSLPLTIYYFNQFSLLSFIANFTLVPLFSLVALPAGYIALIVSGFHAPFGMLLAKPAVWCNAAGFRIMEWLDSLSMFHLIWPSPPLWALPLYYSLLGIAAAGIHRFAVRDRAMFPQLRRSGARMLAAGCAGLFVWTAVMYNWTAWGKSGRVSFIDVGQGDAILVQTPDDRTVLIDGGGTIRFYKPDESWRLGNDPYEVGEDLLVPLLKKRGIRRIDVLVASHADTDHIGGLLAVLKSFPVERLLFNGTIKETAAARQLFTAAIDLGVPLQAVARGDVIGVDSRTSLCVLYPDERQVVRFEPKQNETSVVLMLQMYGARLLLTGDIGTAEEEKILSSMQQPANVCGGRQQMQAASEVIVKIAHHGSKHSTSSQWLDYWQPDAAVVSVGANNVYGHPSKETAGRLAERNIPLLRTDRHGEIALRIDAEGIRIRTRFPVLP